MPWRDFAPNAPNDCELDPQYAGANVEMVRHFDGETLAVDVQSVYAYLVVGSRVMVVDISNPANPVLKGKSAFTNVIFGDIAVQGSYAYAVENVVSTGWNSYCGGLVVYDVSNPASPVRVAYFTNVNDPHAVKVSGSHVYLVDGDTLKILDVSNPLAPVLVKTVNLPDTAYGLDVGGNYVYVVVNGLDGLRIIDVSDPANAHEVSSLATPGYATDVVVSGGYAYIADEANLFIADVSDPLHPAASGSTPDQIDGFERVALSGQVAYLNSKTQLTLVDVANPASPSVVVTYTVAAPIADFAVAGDTAFLADQSAGLVMLDVSDPNSIAETGRYNPSPGIEIDAIQGNYGVGGSEYEGLRVYDLSNPLNPVEAGSVGVNGSVAAVEGDIAYVIKPFTIWSSTFELDFVSIANPAQPQLAGKYELTSQFNNVVVKNGLAFIANQDLHILDVSDPQNPAEIGLFPLPEYSESKVATQGNYVYVADGYSGLRIIDITDPKNPVEAGFYLPGTINVTCAAVSGDYVAICRKTVDTVDVIDVSDPSAPVNAGGFIVNGEPSEIILQGEYAYVDADRSGVQIYSLADMANIGPKGNYFLPYTLDSLAVTDDYLYALDRKAGQHILWFGPAAYGIIPEAGGVITSTFDSTSYAFASGTFTTTVEILHRPRYSGNITMPFKLQPVGHTFENSGWVYNFGGNVQIGKPYTMTIQYSDDDIKGKLEDTLALYHFDGQAWEPEPTSQVYTSTNTLTASPDRFGLWAVLAEPSSPFLYIYLPFTRRN